MIEKLKIYQVIDRNRTFMDIYDSYSNVERYMTNYKVISLEYFHKNFRLLDSNNTLFVLWHDVDIPKTRKSKICIHYSEMIGDFRYKPQLELFNRFLSRLNLYDHILVHTEFAMNMLKQYCSHVTCCPIGYDSTVYGVPDFLAEKEYDVCFIGSKVGRRQHIINYLKSYFKSRFYNKPIWGNIRKIILDRSKIYLIIPWERNTAFTTMRLYQSIGSSVVMAVENNNMPIDNNLFISITNYDDEERTLEELDRYLTSDLLSISKLAHEQLSTMTVKDSIYLSINQLKEHNVLIT